MMAKTGGGTYSMAMQQIIAQQDEQIQSMRDTLSEVYTTIDALMAWDNNILDEPHVCVEYKACVQAALALVAKLELQGYAP